MKNQTKSLLGRAWDIAKRFGKSAVETIKAVPGQVKAFVLGGAGVMAAEVAQAQTEAHAIITSVDTAFDLIVPITVAIVTFFVVIRLAKRVVK